MEFLQAEQTLPVLLETWTREIPYVLTGEQWVDWVGEARGSWYTSVDGLGPP
jgi:hypothetical protein